MIRTFPTRTAAQTFIDRNGLNAEVTPINLKSFCITVYDGKNFLGSVLRLVTKR